MKGSADSPLCAFTFPKGGEKMLFEHLTPCFGLKSEPEGSDNCDNCDNCNTNLEYHYIPSFS